MAKKRNADRGLFQRGKRWYLRAYLPGVGKRVFACKPTGSSHATTDKAVARIIARRIREQIKDQKQRGVKPLPAMLDDFAKTAALVSQEKQVTFGKRVVGAFLKQQKINAPAEITAGRIRAYMAELHEAGRAPKTIQNHRIVLGGFCEFLRSEGAIDRNPVRDVKPPKIPKPEPVFLTAEQVDEALVIAEKHGLYAEVAVAIYTGVRRSELARLRWADVRLDAKTLRVFRSKSKTPRAIPLTAIAIGVLRRQRDVTGNVVYVFPGHRDGMRPRWWWEDAIKPLQDAMPVFQERPGKSVGRAWHMFRHTFGSHLAQRGVSLAKIREWMGHESITTTMVYAHLAPGYDPDIEKLEDMANGSP